MKLERDYQPKLIKKIKTIFPDAFVFKMDPNYIQGIPDLLILENDKWAMLETKRSSKASHRPNQEYYIDILDRMSFASFIYPENEEEVLYELQRALSI